MTGKVICQGNRKIRFALVDYYGIGSEDGQNFFQPFTTTLIELRLNRDPKPFTAYRVKLCYFGEWEQDG